MPTMTPSPAPPSRLPDTRPRVLIVGSGFAGFHAARRLERLLGPTQAELVLVSPTDYLLYSPLLPEVATGAIEPRHIAVPLRQALPRTRTVLGHVTSVDMQARTVTVEAVSAGLPGGAPDVPGADAPDPATASSAPASPAPASRSVLHWDRLILTPGSVTRQFDVPGLAEHAHGLKTLTEAVFLRDHVLAQLDLADACSKDAAGQAERKARLTVVAVGAGYTGTEFVAQMQRWVMSVEDRWQRTRAQDVRWLLVDLAPTVLPELGPKLGATALNLLHARGVEVRLGVSVASATARSVTLTDGDEVPAYTLVWSAGVAANPLVATLGAPLNRGRLVVDEQLRVPALESVWAAGDAAAVPDLTKPVDDGGRPVTPPTAQHAQRQGVALGRNVAASLGVGTARRYRHRDLGLVADLGGPDAVAKPLGIPLQGRVAKVVTRGYHMFVLPGRANKARVVTDWLLGAVFVPQVVQLSAVREQDALITQAQGTALYAPPVNKPTS